MFPSFYSYLRRQVSRPINIGVRLRYVHTLHLQHIGRVWINHRRESRYFFVGTIADFKVAAVKKRTVSGIIQLSRMSIL
jgi:hypothetical protein